MQTLIVRNDINTAVARLEAWLETMRGPGGYGGPVAHWWQQSLIYTGPGLDWRYEGIIEGYLQLWARTGKQKWLQKACRAGDDLLAGQLENGHYAASTFELNPATGGTPHEAACDVGLLMLAQVLQKLGNEAWERYTACAERNLQAFYVEQLWDPIVQSIRDHPHIATFVPNKAATACEAFFLLAEVRQDASWVEQYALPTLERVMQHQFDDRGRLNGAIAQNSFGSRRIEKYFPIYIARCVPALLRAYGWTNQERYVTSALRAMRFITRWMYRDGSLPTVVYANQQVNRYPSWLAPLGDVLYAAEALRPYGFEEQLSATHRRLLAAQDASGGIQTAKGFAAQAAFSPNPSPNAEFGTSLPDVRDVLHVVGWCDKAFRYLASQIDSDFPIEVEPIPEKWYQPPPEMTFETDCTFQGQIMHYRETPELLEITARPLGSPPVVCYRWQKGQPWAEIATPAFWLK